MELSRRVHVRSKASIFCSLLGSVWMLVAVACSSHIVGSVPASGPRDVVEIQFAQPKNIFAFLGAGDSVALRAVKTLRGSVLSNEGDTTVLALKEALDAKGAQIDVPSGARVQIIREAKTRMRVQGLSDQRRTERRTFLIIGIFLAIFLLYSSFVNSFDT